MSRKKKVELVAKTLETNSFGTPLSSEEYRWLAEHVIDALKAAKVRDGDKQ